ncbi:lytic polysaccharide monooxygenase [Streptomyces sp. CNQ085]|uniref:lytic polysaccharide monooxygenase n=1 Tax=Streptomyces sp. CNQ085 TaxID=2886944 RepID=UPI001F50E04E|nr:lytic polysaccharide monooxygenase [Streptomyces sp. CNQ085]MCI0383234.1 lytic polysaccharide monooxygenase [Streptomyces sp. CNQ085]
MNTKKRVVLALGAMAAPLLAVSLPAGTANAHGWVTDPGSRQDQCAAGVVDCGQISYEPQSVEGPKGLKSCSGGNEQFAELDDDSKAWRVTPVGSSHTFTWSLTARHSTDTWQYFIGDRKIAEFDGKGVQPPSQVSHQVNFDGLTGRQKVLAVWNVADTANAFYACIDVNIGGTGGGDGGGDGEPGACASPAWGTGNVYTGGDTVTHDGHTWRAKWWTRGEEPGATGEWGVWEDLGACAAA